MAFNMRGTFGDILAGKETLDILLGVFRRYFSGGPAAAHPSGSSEGDGTQKAKDDGKGLDDEYFFLIAAAEAYGRDLFGQDIAQVDPEAVRAELARNRVSKFNAMAKVLRAKSGPGAVAKLMHIIGRESHLQGQTHKQQPKRGQKPIDPAAPIEYLQAKHRTNPTGQLIMLYLTSMDVNEAVDLLMEWSITDNPGDSARAAAKAAKDKADEFLERWKEFYGQHDTAFHQFAFLVSTNRDALNRVMESEPAKRLWAAIEAAPEGEKRKRHEAYQAFLLSMVRAYKNPTIVRAQEREAGIKPRRITLPRVIIALGISCVILVGIIGIL